MANIRSFEEEKKYIHRKDKTSFTIDKGFVPNMKVEGRFYVNSCLEKIVFEELASHCEKKSDGGGFLPAVKQIANVAGLPGIVGASIGLPDVHAGYGFAIGEREFTTASTDCRNKKLSETFSSPRKCGCLRLFRPRCRGFSGRSWF